MAFKMSSVTVLVCVLVTAMAIAPIAESQLGIFNTLLGLLRIQGTIFCTSNGTIAVNGTSASTPVFTNALVQLQCGNGNNVVSSAMTNSSGVFSMILDPIRQLLLLSTLLRDCHLVVPTPLSTCNASLPAVGTLFSSLQTLGTTTLGFTDIVPTGFLFTQN